MQANNPSVRAATVVFAIVFLILSLLLLAQIGGETKFSPRGKLFAQPRTWPAIGIGGMVIFSLGLVASRFRSGVAGAMPEMTLWARSLEYLGWFMLYVVLVPVIGYLPATVLFATVLALRLGYRNPTTLLLAALLGAVVVLVFKAGLSVRIPGGAVYDYLPDALRNFMIVNL
jgi:hypothetical protein